MIIWICTSYTVYEVNNGAIVVTTIPKITPTSNNISFKYNIIIHNIGKQCVIQNIEYNNQKKYIFTKCLQGKFLSVLVNCYEVDKSSDKREYSKKWNLWPYIDILCPKRVYFGLWKNIHIFILYFYILYRYKHHRGFTVVC